MTNKVVHQSRAPKFAIWCFRNGGVTRANLVTTSVRHKTEVQSLLDEPDTNVCAVVFQIPQDVLDTLRRRRATQTLKHSHPVQPGTTVDIAVAAVNGTARSDAAVAFVNFMNSLQSQVETNFDAFLLDPGMGPMQYLTNDGRILMDYRTWDGDGLRFDQDLDRAIHTVVCGARKTGIASLERISKPGQAPLPLQNLQEYIAFFGSQSRF